MADYITPEQAKALQDQYNQALADADNLNQQYQNNMNGNTQTTTTNNPTQSEMDAMKDLYPNLQYPSDYNNTNTTQTPPNTTANNDPWSWNNTPSTTTTTTETTPTTDDLWAEYNALFAKGQAGTALTNDELVRLNQLYDILYNGKDPGNTPNYPTNPTNPPNPSSPTNPTNPSNPSSTTDSQDSTTLWNEYWALIQKGQSGTALTNDELIRLNQLYDMLNGKTPGNTGTPGTGIPGTGTPGSNIPGSGVTHNYPAVDMDNLQRIKDMYDAQIEAQRAALQEQGDQALSDAQANRDKIASLYNKQRNAASVDWERQRRNFLEGAATSGINTGAGSQAELSMMSAYQRSQNDLGAAQAQSEADADRNIADIKRSTQASINEAIAKNDYQKAAALLDEYNEQYNRAVDRAEALAKFGDFSGYAALYGDDAAAQMRYTWVMSNPEIALAMGQITQQQYAALTLYKQYPALALTGGAGFSGGGGGGDGSGTSTGTGTGTTTNDNTSGNAPSYSGMTPATYAAYINSLVASGEISGEEGQKLIREAYGQTG